MLKFSSHRGVVRAFGALRVNIMTVIAPSGPENSVSPGRKRTRLMRGSNAQGLFFISSA